jgi:hypothetical protein
MEGILSTINDEMKETADYAIKASRERFKLELDFSEPSIAQLDKILDRIYWGFSSQNKDKSESGLIFQTAMIWGSYLGEFMRRKWGGTWIFKGKDRLLSIINIEFSPINLVYQKITTHPEYSVKNYLIESARMLNDTPVITPQPPQYLSEEVGQPKKKTGKPTRKIFKNRLFLPLAIAGVILLVIVDLIGGYLVMRTSAGPAFSFFISATKTNTGIPIAETSASTLSYTESSQTQTSSPLPTSTPSPTFTPSPSLTPSQTYTQIATYTATDTYTPVIPTQTNTPRPTSRPRIPTKTPEPPTERPQPPATEQPQPSATAKPQPTATELPPPTSTPRPQPTATQPPPVGIDSCDVDPSTVPVGLSVTITFIVHFSAPGYGFDSSIDSNFNGTQDCSGVDSDGDGVAYCDGSSGELPASTTVYATLSSSVGDCVVSYSSR